MTVAINHSDPGAVPGASTQAHPLQMGFGGGEPGSTRA